MRILSIIKRLFIALALISVVGFIGIVLFIELMLAHKTPMGECDFQNANVVVSFWTQEDWDTGPMVFYDIRHDGKLVVPTTYHASHRENNPFPLHKFATSDGKLLAVTHDLPYCQSRIVIYDTESKESWPRSRNDYDQEVKQKWRARYARLKKEHPDLIEEPYFTGTNSQQSTSANGSGGSPSP